MADEKGGLKPNPQFVSDEKFFAQHGIATSLPVNNPTEPATSLEPEPPQADKQDEPKPTPQESKQPEEFNPNPLAPQVKTEAAEPVKADEPERVTEPPAADEPAPVDILSTDLPAISSESQASVDTGTTSQTVPVPTEFEEFRPKAEDGKEIPQWQHDQFASVVNNESLTSEEKKEILKGSPYGWGKEVKRVRDSRILGKFRDSNVPIGDVLKILGEQNSTRIAELELESVNSVLNDGSKALRFAEQHPDTYGKLLFALVDSAPEQVTEILSRRGYTVAKAEPVNADSILDRLKENPFYDAIKGTEYEEEIFEEIRRLAAGQTANPTDPANPEPKDQPVTASQEVAQQQMQTYQEVQSKVWDASVAEGLKMGGIRPATQEEIQRNPLALMKTIIHSIGVHGLAGVIPSSDEQVDKFVGENPDYLETVDTLTRQIQSGDFDGFKTLAKDLQPTYYRLGQARSGIPMLKGLYREVQRLLGEIEPVKQPENPNPVPNPDERTAPVTNNTVPVTTALEEKLANSPFASDRLALKRMQAQGG